MANIARRDDGRWRARYRDESGKEHARHFNRKTDAQRWLDEVTTAVLTGAYVDPKTARTTVGDWCDQWLTGYATRRASTVRQAEVHVAKIKEQFETQRLSAVRPSQVRAWTAKLKADGLSTSYVYALHNRFSQIMADAVHDGVAVRNPCSRRTSPGTGQQRAYVATTERVWALYDKVAEHLKPAILLGAFAGLRTAEVCGLRVGDVDFMRGIVTPALQWPGIPLKTEKAQTAIPIPNELALRLSSYVASWPSEFVVTNGSGESASPWSIDRMIRSARKKIEGLPEDFRFHDLRHYFASLLIASGSDVKVVQARLRHASAKTTLDVYGHLWPDSDESTRAAVSAVLVDRADFLRTGEASAR